MQPLNSFATWLTWNARSSSLVQKCSCQCKNKDFHSRWFERVKSLSSPFKPVFIYNYSSCWTVCKHHWELISQYSIPPPQLLICRTMNFIPQRALYAKVGNIRATHLQAMIAKPNNCTKILKCLLSTITNRLTVVLVLTEIIMRAMDS